MDVTALQDGTTAGRQPPGSGLAPVRWQLSDVTSPQLARPVRVVVARGIPYVPDANRFESLSIYLPVPPRTLSLVGTVATSLPDEGESSRARYLVHVHGGAWRDPALDAASIEPTIAHAFSVPDGPTPVPAIASIDYTVSPFRAARPSCTTPSGTSTPTRHARRSSSRREVGQ